MPTRICCIAGKSSLMLATRGSMSIKVGKPSNSTSNFSKLGTSVEAFKGGCVLGVKLSLEIVKVSSTP